MSKNSISSQSLTVKSESKKENAFEYDHAGNRIYPVIEAPNALNNGILVDPDVLESLAARYDAPHFRIQNFEVVKNGIGFGLFEGKRWTAHFTQLPQGIIVSAYEPFEGKEGKGE